MDEQSEIDSMKTIWNNYKIENINNLLINVNKIINESENKDIDFSAAVKPDYYLAKMKSQDWMEWLDLELLDFVVLMNYASDNLKFIDPILQILTRSNGHEDNIVMGVSTYNQSANQVSDKLCTSYKSQFKGISLFSYNSIEDNQKDDLFWFNPILEFFMINVKKGIKMNKLKIKSPTGNKLICKGWHQEAAYRMIQTILIVQLLKI